MGLFLIIIALVLAPIFVTRAGALLIAIAAGWAAYLAAAPLFAAIGIWLVTYVGADLVLRSLAERGDWVGRSGLGFTILCGTGVLGGLAFLVGNDGGERTGLALLFGLIGATTGGLLAYRHYRVLV
jgi:hypothetical protein